MPDEPQALATPQLEGDIADRPELVLPQGRKDEFWARLQTAD
jgi:hypothetical protein